MLANSEKKSDWSRNLSKGDLFGEISFMLDTRPTATVQAITYVQTLSISAKDWQYCVKQNRELQTVIQSSIIFYDDPRTQEL